MFSLFNYSRVSNTDSNSGRCHVSWIVCLLFAVRQNRIPPFLTNSQSHMASSKFDGFSLAQYFFRFTHLHVFFIYQHGSFFWNIYLPPYLFKSLHGYSYLDIKIPFPIYVSFVSYISLVMWNVNVSSIYCKLFASK